MHRNTAFYDQLTPFYHLIHQDWNGSIERQGQQLSALIEREWPGKRRVLDVACGIGTQALALARLGYAVTASDLSPAEVARAKLEAKQRNLQVAFSVCDMRQVHAHHGSEFDVVVCADNSLPHLLSNDEIRGALEQMYACAQPGGGCVITVRDYDAEPRGTGILKPYGVRIEGGKRYLPFQVWDFEGPFCNITFFFVEEELSSGAVRTHAMRSKYFAVSISVLLELMADVGFQNVRRLDDAFYQPVLIGTRGA
ncbi:class I SAM-dependent methyltransferase [Rhodoferax sp.]|uniref:class I SAM-dependent methyltransferase n=1 Tax=Rhodoferax sp. TaxID=50421 RepID=UPI00277A7F60|nr:class I SAM-dependent methyltransferase [Rhodoferax sp.]